MTETSPEEAAVATPKRRRTRVYVAGPMLTSGNPYLNVRTGIRTGTMLMKRGYVPFIPHLTAVWEIAAHEEFSYEDWLALDFTHISVCDALLRLPGDSRGADREATYAQSLGIPIYYSLDTLFACEKPEREDVRR